MLLLLQGCVLRLCDACCIAFTAACCGMKCCNLHRQTLVMSAFCQELWFATFTTSQWMHRCRHVRPAPCSVPQQQEIVLPTCWAALLLAATEGAKPSAATAAACDRGRMGVSETLPRMLCADQGLMMHTYHPGAPAASACYAAQQACTKSSAVLQH